ASPVSPILIAILGGLLVRNTIGVPAIYELGLELCLKRILRVGVALLGIRLSLLAAGATGLVAVPIALATIGTALLLVTWLSRVVGLPKRLGMLIAVGTAICGNTAIVATGPVIGADEDEVSYAVACITLFGLFALIVHPFIAFELFAGDGHLAGLFLGSAIHDTAQVAGAGLLYAQQFGDTSALESATVTKLVRNLFMVGVIPLMAAFYHESSEGKGEVAKPSVRQLVPFFVFGFIAMAFVRTLGDVGERPFGFLDPDVWALVIKSTSTVSTFCLTIAMATVGLGTNLRRLQMLGLKPLAVGLGAALIVGTVGAGMIKLIAPMIG
nr:putative sulfate exporter family transporter [Pseudomonadota bacterium]